MRATYILLALTIAARTLRADCIVSPLEVVDHSRTIGIPFASPADPGANAVRVRALVWTRGTSPSRPTYAALIRSVVPDVDPAEHLTSRLRFYGAVVDTAGVAAAISAAGTCGAAGRPTRPGAGIVLIVGAFPAVMYEGAAAALAERDIATIVTSGGESNVRLILNYLATLGWPVDRLALVGHGAGGPVVHLVGMSSSAVRGIVSLDGFEALDPVRYPGLTGDPGWRPGNLRAPVLHWRPTGHPDADTTYYAAAARSALLQITLTGTVGRPNLTAPEVALAPRALQRLIGAAGGAIQETVTRATIEFLASALAGTNVESATLHVGLPASFAVARRAPLPAPAIRADGRLDEPLWERARTLPDATTITVRVVEDCDYLYAAVVPNRVAPFITELFVDVPGAATASPAANHLLLHASASLCWVYGRADVARADCNKNEAWWGASRTSQAGDPPVAEYIVAKRAIGLSQCESASRLRLGALVGGFGTTALYPAGADKARPSTWDASELIQRVG